MIPIRWNGNEDTILITPGILVIRPMDTAQQEKLKAHLQAQTCCSAERDIIERRNRKEEKSQK